MWKICPQGNFLGLEPSNKESRPRCQVGGKETQLGSLCTQIGWTWTAQGWISGRQACYACRGAYDAVLVLFNFCIRCLELYKVNTTGPGIWKAHVHISGDASISLEASQALSKLAGHLSVLTLIHDGSNRNNEQQFDFLLTPG